MSQISTPDYASRHDTVRRALQERYLDALLVFSPANRRYLTGFTAQDGGVGESSGSVLITRERVLLLVSPLYIEQARAESAAAEPRELKERSTKLLPEILGELGVRRLAFERDYTLYGYYEDLKENLSEGSELVPVKRVVEEMRLRKDEAERELMREAARIADAAYVRVTEALRPGATEHEVARALDDAMVELGADGPSFETIVAAGENAARPHHESGHRPMREGEPIVIDMGARYRGYCSDMTRSFCLGRADDRFSHLYELVLAACEAGKEAVRAGASGKDVDAVARKLLSDAGYGEQFSHSLGHGVGLAVHEGPGLGKNSEDTLEEGMVVTVEPGLYFGGWGGIRIEDTVLVTGEGHEVWTHAPKAAVI